MKKITSLLLCFVLVAAFCTVAFAATLSPAYIAQLVALRDQAIGLAKTDSQITHIESLYAWYIEVDSTAALGTDTLSDLSDLLSGINNDNRDITYVTDRINAAKEIVQDDPAGYEIDVDINALKGEVEATIIPPTDSGLEEFETDFSITKPDNGGGDNGGGKGGGVIKRTGLSLESLSFMGAIIVLVLSSSVVLTKKYKLLNDNE